jgi:MFS family permease
MSQIGRRKSLIIVDLISICGLILSVVAVLVTSLYLNILSRCILGITTGLNATIVPLYIKEMSPDALSDKTPLNNLMPIYIK